MEWCAGSGEGEEGRGKYHLHYTNGEVVQVDWIINASGVGLHSDSTSDVLFNGLLSCGLAEANEFGGFVCDFHTQRILPFPAWSSTAGDVGQVPLIYGIGHVVAGTRLLSSGLSYCSYGAMISVADALKRLEDKTINL